MASISKAILLLLGLSWRSAGLRLQEQPDRDVILSGDWLYDDDGEQVDVDLQPAYAAKSARYVDGTAGFQHGTEVQYWKDFDYGNSMAVCPKVYVYDLPEPFQDLDLKKLTQAYAFGTKTGPSTYETNQFSLPMIFLYRILHSGHCHTMDPSAADLFFIPLLAAPKGSTEMQEACARIAHREKELQSALPFLNETTATKHFMVLAKGFYAGWSCYGIWSSPGGLLAKAARLSVEAILSPERQSEIRTQHGDEMQMFQKHFPPPRRFPRHYAVPYPSGVHLSDQSGAREWASHIGQSPRTVLASYVGKPTHGDMAVRQAIHKLCMNDKQNWLSCAKFHSNKQILSIKESSDFCLEPLGDSIGRKSLSDDYAAGCIPVFIGNAQGFQYPTFWEGWERPFVAMNRPVFISGGHKYLYAKLQALKDSGEVDAIRKTMQAKGMRFIYNTKDIPEAGDDAVLVALKQLSSDA